jgi:hypothetical protein
MTPRKRLINRNALLPLLGGPGISVGKRNCGLGLMFCHLRVMYGHVRCRLLPDCRPRELFNSNEWHKWLAIVPGRQTV